MSDLEARIVDAIHWVHLPKGGVKDQFVRLDANAAHAVAELLAPLIREREAEAWDKGADLASRIYPLDYDGSNPYRSNNE